MIFLSQKAFVLTLFLAIFNTISTMEIEGSIKIAANRRLETLLNHLKTDQNDLRGEIMNSMNNQTKSAFYAFIAGTVLATGTVGAMDLTQSRILPAQHTQITAEHIIEQVKTLEKINTELHNYSTQLLNQVYPKGQSKNDVMANIKATTKTIVTCTQPIIDKTDIQKIQSTLNSKHRISNQQLSNLVTQYAKSKPVISLLEYHINQFQIKLDRTDSTEKKESINKEIMALTSYKNELDLKNARVFA